MIYIDTLYCCFAPEGFNTPNGLRPDYTTLSVDRKGSVEKFINGLSHPWKYWYNKGWRCVKIEMSIQPKKPLK